jgi:hypothetical protein
LVHCVRGGIGKALFHAAEDGTSRLNLLVEFFDLAMMRRAMLGIKQRAETAPKS